MKRNCQLIEVYLNYSDKPYLNYSDKPMLTRRHYVGGSLMALNEPQAFSVPSKESALAFDAAQLCLTNEIFQLIDQHRESKNIIERWLLSMMNMPQPKHILPKHILPGHILPGQISIYRHTNITDPINVQFQTELLEKKVVPPSKVDRLVQHILDMVDKFLQTTITVTSENIICNDVLQYTCGLSQANAQAPRFEKFQFTHQVDLATARLLQIGGCTATVAAALRYAALMPAGQQWGIPQAHIDFLYNEWSVRNEAFASPFNSRLVGKPGASFCSIFEEDKVFGSIGDFFAQTTLSGNWVVNPPFVDELLVRAVQKCLKALEHNADRVQTIFFIMPAWQDSQAYELLHKSQYTAAELFLKPGTYYYESPNGKRINTRAGSIYFALSQIPEPAVESRWHIRHMRALEQIL